MRADAVRRALSSADINHDGRLSSSEQRRAKTKVAGASSQALTEAYKQARMKSGSIDVKKARGLVSLAESRALLADRNHNGISSFERGRLSGPIARALTLPPPGAVPAPTHTGGIRVSDTMRRLAHNAQVVARSMGGSHSQGLCATGVSRNIARSMGLSVRGNGNQIDNNLPRSKFRQVNLTLSQALKIPGLVLTWEKTSTRLGQRYGHTAVTLGNGRSLASDFIEQNTLGARGRSGFKVFMPI